MSSSIAAERENRLRRLRIYSGKDPLYQDMYKVGYAKFDDQPKSEVKEDKMKVKKGMTNKAGHQEPLICVPIDVRKKKLKPGELSEADRDDIARAFGATDGVSLVDDREYTLDQGGWH